MTLARRPRPASLAVEELEGRLTPTFDVTFTVGHLPAATNPYVSLNPALANLNNKVFASSYGTYGATGQNIYLTWDSGGNVTTHVGNDLPVVPPINATGTQGQNTITVSPADAADIAVGMRAFGGIPNGNAIGSAGGIVVGVDPTTGVVTLNVQNLVTFTSGPVTFTNTLPDQEITGDTFTLHLPTAQDLSSVRVIFTLGAEGWFAMDSGGGVAAPTAFGDPYYREVYFDFVEFTLNTTGGAAEKFTLNTSTVDQFGFPIQISVAPDNPGPPGGAGVKATRDGVIAQYTNFITNSVSDPNARTFYQQLATLQEDPNGVPYRIMSPTDRVNLAKPTTQNPVALPAGINTYFDGQIKAFFDAYDQTLNPGATFAMINVPGGNFTGKGPTQGSNTNLHDLSGSVVTLAGGQRVLQLTDVTQGPYVVGAGNVYTVYEPFFSTNGYPNKPAPPAWLNGTTESPGEMVFAGDGVFADNTVQPGLDGNQQILLGAIENQVVTALNRGIVLNPYSDWLYSVPTYQVPAQLTVNTGDTVTIPSTAFIPQIVPGMAVTGTGIATGQVVTVTDVEANPDGTTTVTLSQPTTVTTPTQGNLVFSYAGLPNPFYTATANNPGVWNYYSQFLHRPDVSINGLAYGISYDDQGSFSSTIVTGVPGQVTPQGATVHLGPQAVPLAFPAVRPGTARIGRDPFDAGSRALFVSGTVAADVIEVTRVGGGGLRVTVNGRVVGRFAGVDGHIIVHGRAGADVIRLAPGITQRAWLSGGGGADTLVSAAGEDILLGGRGRDRLRGGLGRDVLLGEGGVDDLRGDHGIGPGGEDILIGGSTIWDAPESGGTDLAALAALQAAWAAPDPYAARVGAISGGAAAPLDAATLVRDRARDVLVGASGLDWFVELEQHDLVRTTPGEVHGV